jgi:hypothetical protein
LISDAKSAPIAAAFGSGDVSNHSIDRAVGFWRLEVDHAVPSDPTGEGRVFQLHIAQFDLEIGEGGIGPLNDGIGLK